MPERFERQFFEQKEIPQEKEEFEISKEKIGEPSEYWERNLENEVKNLKEEFGENIDEIGASERVLQEAEENLRNVAQSFKDSERKLKEKGREKIKKFCKDLFKTIVLTVTLKTQTLVPFVSRDFPGPAAIGREFEKLSLLRPVVRFLSKREIAKVERLGEISIIVEEEKTLEEKIEYLKEKWGGFKNLTKALFSEESWDHLYEAVRKEYLPASEPIQDWEKFAELMLRKALETQLQDFYLPKEEIKAEKDKGLEIVAGFERMGVKNEIIKELIEKTFPKSWIGPNLSLIEYQNIRETLNIGSIIAEVVGLTFDTSEKFEGAISLLGGSKELLSLKFLHLLAHEIAHVNDWRSANHLSFEERVDLFYAITRRIEADDRYRSQYVEAIRRESKVMEMYRKCAEYWAEIVAEFLVNPWSESLPLKDAQLVYSFIKKYDPDFDPFEAALSRIKMVRNYPWPADLEEPKVDLFPPEFFPPEMKKDNEEKGENEKT